MAGPQSDQYLVHFLDSAGNDAWVTPQGSIFILTSAVGPPVLWGIFGTGTSQASAGLTAAQVTKFVAQFVVLEAA